jgi:glycerol-3-phosphate cytidylyltransferase
MGTVITYGTFDLFHIGHLNLFRRLKLLGSNLIVAVSTDEFNAEKGKRSIIPFEHRIEIVRSIKLVDEVIPETSWEQKIPDIKNRKVDIFAIGDDWEGKFDFLREHCQVVYIPRTQGVSSTNLRRMLDPLSKERIDELKAAAEVLAQIVNDLE